MSLLKGFQSWFNQSSPLWPFNQAVEEAYSQYFFESQVKRTVRYRQAQSNALSSTSTHYLAQAEPTLPPNALAEATMAEEDSGHGEGGQQLFTSLAQTGNQTAKLHDSLGRFQAITARESSSTVVNLFLDQTQGYINQELWDKAIATCQKTIALEPQRAEAHRLMGKTLHAKGQTFEAMGCYADALALQPDLVEAYADLGFLYSDLGEWDQAITYYEKAIALADASESVSREVLRATQEGLMDAQCQVQRQVDQTTQKTDEIYNALSLSPETFTAEEHCEMGQLLVQQGDSENAMECFHRAIDCQPSCVTAHLQLASLLEDRQQWKESMFHYKQAVQQRPQSISEDLVQAKSDTHLLTSEEFATTSRATSPQLVPPKTAGYRSMRVSAPRSTPSQASTANPSVIKPLGPKPLNQLTAHRDVSEPSVASIQAFVALARSYEEHGDMDKAIAHYRNALSLDPKNRDIHQELTRVLHQQTAKN